METKRIIVKYSGRVQGVYFRATACDFAKKRDLVGFVRNEHDGTVYLVAEGSTTELEGLLCDIRASHLGPNISQAEVTWTDVKGDFNAFQILYT